MESGHRPQEEDPGRELLEETDEPDGVVKGLCSQLQTPPFARRTGDGESGPSGPPPASGR